MESGFAELQARWFQVCSRLQPYMHTWYEMEGLLIWVFWVQFSIFCSITRLHGDRNPKEAPNTVPLQEQCDPTGAAGGPIEPWVLGDEAYSAVKSALSLRASMLPYLKEQVALLATRGTPVMRPLWFDFSSDPRAVRAITTATLFFAAANVNKCSRCQDTTIERGGKWLTVRLCVMARPRLKINLCLARATWWRLYSPLARILRNAWSTFLEQLTRLHQGSWSSRTTSRTRRIWVDRQHTSLWTSLMSFRCLL